MKFTINKSGLFTNSNSWQLLKINSIFCTAFVGMSAQHHVGTDIKQFLRWNDNTTGSYNVPMSSRYYNTVGTTNHFKLLPN